MEQDNGPAKRRYAITVEFELEAGARAEFLRLIHANAAESVKSEAGCLRFDVLAPLEPSRSTVFLYEIYTDKVAFQLHLASAHFQAFDRQSAALVTSKSVNEYDVVENLKEGG